MTRAAPVLAHRSNARKSAGPRTAQGKAVVAEAMGAGSQRIAPNEPNLRRIERRRDSDRGPEPNAIVPNKANLPYRRSGRGRARSPAEPPLRLLVQTNPICRHGRKWARAGEGTGGAVARTHCAKRTQSVPTPIGRTGRAVNAGGQSRQTKPIPGALEGMDADRSGHPGRPKRVKQDAHDRSRGVAAFAINTDCIWIYVIFCVDRLGAGVIL